MNLEDGLHGDVPPGTHLQSHACTETHRKVRPPAFVSHRVPKQCRALCHLCPMELKQANSTARVTNFDRSETSFLANMDSVSMPAT